MKSMPRLFPALVLALFSLFLITVTGCGEDTDDAGPEAWQGTWRIATINGVPFFPNETPERVPGFISLKVSISTSVSFDADSGVFRFRMTAAYHDPLRIELKKGGSATLEVVGAYTVHGQTYTLGVGETKWEVSDSLLEIGITRYSLESITSDLSGAVGIWERRDNKLVLTNTNGNITVFEKR